MSNKSNCLLCCFNLCILCGCRKGLIGSHAFYPPECSYQFQELNDQPNNSSKIKQYEFLYKIPDESGSQKLPQIDEMKITCYKIKAHPDYSDFQTSLKLDDKQDFIPVLHIQYLDQSKHRKQVILHSHANSTDLGYMIDNYLDLSHNLRVDVLAYDYSGYGLSSKQSLDDLEIIQNVLSVYKFAQEGLKYPWHEIILYGQSLGSGPSTFLASLREKPVGGLILHSSFSSGLNAVMGQQNRDNSQEENQVNLSNSNGEYNNTSNNQLNTSVQDSMTINGSSLLDQSMPPPIMMNQQSSIKQQANLDSLHKYDFFPNFQLIKYVNCPIYIMHGSKDNVIPISHMQHLITSIKPTTPFYQQIFQGADHNNIEGDYRFRKEYLYRLRQFLTSVKNIQKGKEPAELIAVMQASYWENFKHIYQEELQKINQQNRNKTQISIGLVDHFSSKSSEIADRTNTRLSSFTFNPQKNRTLHFDSFGPNKGSEIQDKSDNFERTDNNQQSTLVSQQTMITQNFTDPETPTHLMETNISSQTMLTDDVDMHKQLKQDLLTQ